MASILQRSPEFDSTNLQILQALHEAEKRRIQSGIRQGRLSSIRGNAGAAARLLPVAALVLLALI